MAIGGCPKLAALPPDMLDIAEDQDLVALGPRRRDRVAAIEMVVARSVQASTRSAPEKTLRGVRTSTSGWRSGAIRSRCPATLTDRSMPPRRVIGPSVTLTGSRERYSAPLLHPEVEVRTPRSVFSGAERVLVWADKSYDHLDRRYAIAAARDARRRGPHPRRRRARLEGGRRAWGQLPDRYDAGIRGRSVALPAGR